MYIFGNIYIHYDTESDCLGVSILIVNNLILQLVMLQGTHKSWLYGFFKTNHKCIMNWYLGLKLNKLKKFAFLCSSTQLLFMLLYNLNMAGCYFVNFVSLCCSVLL